MLASNLESPKCFAQGMVIVSTAEREDCLDAGQASGQSGLDSAMMAKVGRGEHRDVLAAQTLAVGQRDRC